jgi:hypothetical protein
MESIAEMESTKNSKRCVVCESVMHKLFSVPTLFTETAYFGRKKADPFGGDIRTRKLAEAIATRAGVSTVGKTFMPSLCRKGKFLDPQAWVGDASDIRRAATAADMNVNSGFCKVKQPEPVVVERPYRVADDIVESEVEERVEKEYGGRIDPKARRILSETVREEITPKNHLVPQEVIE